MPNRVLSTVQISFDSSQDRSDSGRIVAMASPSDRRHSSSQLANPPIHFGRQAAHRLRLRRKVCSRLPPRHSGGSGSLGLTGVEEVEFISAGSIGDAKFWTCRSCIETFNYLYKKPSITRPTQE